MADPLSIAASIAGLLAVAAKVSSAIIDFCLAVHDAPESARAALTTVEGMRLTLVSVELLIDKFSQLPRERKEMIHLRHLIVVFREAILSFSELEAAVFFIGKGQGKTPIAWDRMRWMVEEKKITQILQRVDSHRSSLSSMLSVLQCQSELEARDSLQHVQKTVQNMMDKNEMLLRRLEQFDVGNLDGSSIRFAYDNESPICAEGQEQPELHYSNNPPAAHQRLYSKIDSNSVDKAAGNGLISREFEVTLGMSRVYARVQSNDCDVSLTSSAVRSHAWSMLSGLSLNDISVVSVLALPISWEEVNIIGDDLIFLKIIPKREETRLDVGTPPKSRRSTRKLIKTILNSSSRDKSPPPLRGRHSHYDNTSGLALKKPSREGP